MGGLEFNSVLFDLKNRDFIVVFIFFVGKFVRLYLFIVFRCFEFVVYDFIFFGYSLKNELIFRLVLIDFLFCV